MNLAVWNTNDYVKDIYEFSDQSLRPRGLGFADVNPPGISGFNYPQEIFSMVP